MKNLKKLIILSSFILNALITQAQSFSNQCFTDSIFSILLSNEQVLTGGSAVVNEAILPSIHLYSDSKLTLRFDLFATEFRNLSYTLVHCNPDWTPSDIFSNDYLEGYTEDNIDTYTYSQNTTQDYIHYQLTFPSDNMKITKSGNYVVLVHESGDRNKILFTRKFYVLNSKTTITPLPLSATAGQERRTHHQINFNVNQNNVNSTDPSNEYKFVIIKNGNQENINFINPTYINGKILSFHGTKLNIEAGNEFRQFDTRNIHTNVKGIGIHQTMYEAPYYHTILNPAFIRSKRNYLEYSDHNGKAYIQSDGLKSSFTETDYTWVYFYLNTPKDSLSNYYVYGELTSWEKQISAKLKYSEKSKQYVGKLFLKQGVYDYAILTKKKNSSTPLLWSTIEGNYYQTENQYTILVYHKDFTNNYYDLVGLKSFLYK